jgi:two-component system NarL family sensor kinase
LSTNRESARITEQLLTAEQDERRRLALFLHDGPVQTLSGVALMLDAVHYAIEEGKVDDALRVLRDALERHREAIRSLRDLSFNLEPVILRDRGISPAVAALCEDVAMESALEIEADVGAADGLAENVQVALYQIIREAVNAAVHRRPPPSRVSVKVAREDDGRYRAEISDDGGEERRRSFFQVLSERARTLDGRISFDCSEGTQIRLELPPSSGD